MSLCYNNFMKEITSKSNPVIKETKKLLQKKYRKSSYLIEGWHLFDEAVAYGVEILKIFIVDGYQDKVSSYQNTYLVTSEILKELSDSKTPQGIVVEVAYQTITISELTSGKFLVLEDVQDPGNVGTMIRTADAAGYSAVFITDHSADIYNQKTLRSMQGSHFHLPIIRKDIVSILDILKQYKTFIMATTLSKESKDYQSISPQKNFALIMGNEGKGISELVENKADVLVHITMPGHSESLNVAVAAGILMFRFI